MKYLTPEQLVVHPRNVRAKTDYPEGSIEALAVSIGALGLLQGIVVQQIEDDTGAVAYGVLAGRRRMMAIQHLAATGELEDGFKVPCKVVPKDTDHVTALSLAENSMQEPMAPLDEFEAFGAMIDEGETVDTIATSFGTTIRAVKERLRYGLIHEDIRRAMRAGTISLDVIKAYATHPCQETQKRVFDGFLDQPHEHTTWRVRATLAEQDIRADDSLAIFVIDRYRERGGEMVVGLFEEDTVLKDRTLAEAIRDELLMEVAEEAREAQGFKWCETRARIDHGELSAYGRIYRQNLTPDAEGAARLDFIAGRLDEIAEALDSGEEHIDDTAELLSDEYDMLEEEAEALQRGYLPEQAAHAGLVVALAHDGSVRAETGLVRVEDCAALTPPRREEPETSDDDAEAADLEGETNASASPVQNRPAFSPPSTGASTVGLPGNGRKEDPVDPLSAAVLSAALRQDLAVERAYILHDELSENPDLARDVLTFRMATSILSTGFHAGSGIDVAARTAYRMHSRPEAIDQAILGNIDATRETLDLSFLDAALSDGEKFRAFRALDADMKDRILAACVGATVEPQLADNRPGRESFMEAVAAEAMPDIRLVWRPTVDNYWSRVTRDHMLAVLTAFGLVAEAEEHRTVKKATLAKYMETLFAQPFATLTEEQRIAVMGWTPPGMGTQGDMVFETMEDAEDDAASEPVEDGENAAPTSDTAYSGVEPGERQVGINAKGQAVFEDERGVRSFDTGGVMVSEPVPVIPGMGFVVPDPAHRKPDFMTVGEIEGRREAA